MSILSSAVVIKFKSQIIYLFIYLFIYTICQEGELFSSTASLPYDPSEHIYSRGTKVEKMLTLAPERYTAGFCMVAKVILWCI